MRKKQYKEDEELEVYEENSDIVSDNSDEENGEQQALEDKLGKWTESEVAYI